MSGGGVEPVPVLASPASQPGHPDA